jgi:hypothetical protein
MILDHVSLTEESTMLPTERGYYQDADSVGYVTKDGTAYHVQGSEDLEPVWERCGEFSEDVERAKDQGAYQRFEPTRLAYGIDV